MKLFMYFHFYSALDTSIETEMHAELLTDKYRFPGHLGKKKMDTDILYSVIYILFIVY